MLDMFNVLLMEGYVSESCMKSLVTYSSASVWIIVVTVT